MSETIKVVVRVRPMNSKQIGLGCRSIVCADQQNNQISITKPQQQDNTKIFAYDSVFSDSSLQSIVYAKTAYTLVENVLQGYNGTIFAYGQTGCGKTHSMVGKLDVQQLQGIIPRSFGHILNTISQTKLRQFLIRCSFIEIYNEQVRDLLGKDIKRSLEIKQSPDKGVFIKDLSTNNAKTYQQLMQYMNIGNKNRSVGQTAMNKDSSRSHLLFMLYLQSADLSTPQQNRKYIASKLNLVDLAGSQRINKTGAQGQRLQEAKNINLSLSALGNVISALVDGKSHHIPYRDSKLTRLLQDSLGGNTKTVMIANCSPADYNFDETLSTLRYASRAKFIKNKPIINQDPKDALLKQYANQIKKLKQILSKNNPNYRQQDFKQNQDNTDFSSKIKQKQEQLFNQKQQKRLLQQRLKALQKQHLLSQNVKIDSKIKQKVKQARQSILTTPPLKSIQNQLNQQIRKLSNFAPRPTQNPTNIQQYKNLIKSYKKQIKSLQNQLTDIAHEDYLDKELLQSDIRELSKQNKLLQGIVNILLSPKELEKIKEKIQTLEKDNNNQKFNFVLQQKTRYMYGYNQDKQEYRIPNFWLKQKQIILPKLINNESYHLNLNNRNSNNNTAQKNNSNLNLNEDLANRLLNQDQKQKRKKNERSPSKMISNTSNVSSSAQNIDANSNSSQMQVKKNLPARLQPLKCSQNINFNSNLDKNNIFSEKEKQRPRKLQKLVDPRKVDKLSVFGPIHQ